MNTVQLDSERAGFDKWQIYKLIRGEKIGHCRIPETKRLTARNLKRYLDEFERVYVKPIGTWGGANISMIERSGTSIFWTVQGELATPSDLDEILQHYDGIPTIVQQAIPALLYHECPFDIRVHMQRDVDESWVYAGELVRVGGPGIVSNVEISKGSVLPLSSVMCELFAIDQAKFDGLQRRLTEIGYGTCKLFDPYSQIEEVGIDLAMDASQKLWLIEINTNDALGAPSHELFRYLPNQIMYDKIRQRASARTMNTLELLFEMMTNNPDEGV